MKNGKIFLVNGTPRIRPPSPAPTPVTSLPAMTVGAWGDPHMYISVSSVNNRKRTVTKRIAWWDDNKKGPSGNNELKLIELQTLTSTVNIFYTNKNWSNGAKVVANVRVDLNGVSTTYSNTAKVTAGPISLNILKKWGAGANTYLTFEISWNDINNVVKLGGALTVILKRVAANNGRPWNGGSGRFWDGFSRAGQPYGLSRSSFETGIGVQSIEDELQLLSNEAEFLSIIGENFIQNDNIFDNVLDQGENNEGNNAPVVEWDDTTGEVSQVLSTQGGIEAVVDQVLSTTPEINSLVSLTGDNLISISGEILTYI